VNSNLDSSFWDYFYLVLESLIFKYTFKTDLHAFQILFLVEFYIVHFFVRIGSIFNKVNFGNFSGVDIRFWNNRGCFKTKPSFLASICSATNNLLESILSLLCINLKLEIVSILFSKVSLAEKTNL
jgi:hypothetical protein